MPLVPVLADMERLGIAVDIAYLPALSAELAHPSASELEIYRLAGEKFTINSPKQLQTSSSRIGAAAREEKRKPAIPPTRRRWLGWREEHVIVAQILHYRELSKLKSTYVDTLPRLASARTDACIRISTRR